MDWQVFHGWQEDFAGATALPPPVGAVRVTVLDDTNAQLVTTRWQTPTDEAADRSLDRIGWRRIGWRRIGPWQPDWNGRRSAPVTGALATPTTLTPERPDRTIAHRGVKRWVGQIVGLPA